MHSNVNYIIISDKNIQNKAEHYKALMCRIFPLGHNVLWQQKIKEKCSKNLRLFIYQFKFPKRWKDNNQLEECTAL